jgi:Ca2+:H+ antiporter
VKLSLDWLLIFVPVAVVLRFALPHAETFIFATAAVAIVPLAGWLGRATEQIADRTSEKVGGLLNATFGNAAELIIALMALHHGLGSVVKASLTGSIIGNILLVLGMAMLMGGLRYKVQKFNEDAARVRAMMLTLASVALIVPAAYDRLAGPNPLKGDADLSLAISIILLIIYGLSLLFSFYTHHHLFVTESEDPARKHEALWSPARSYVVLGVATALIGWMSEILVSSVEGAAKALGMTEVFVGVVVVAIVGNAAEHSTAITVARRNRMELSVGIAVGSSIQIALFVAPVLVLASYFIGPHPIDLVFTPAEVLAVVLAVVVTDQIAGDGKSNWLEGAQLLAVYIVLALAFYFLPETAPADRH